ncbi:MAG: hypothetical protein ACT4O0_01750 [Pseudonocardia sp.]
MGQAELADQDGRASSGNQAASGGERGVNRAVCATGPRRQGKP